MSHITCQNGLVDRRKPMEELSFAEYLRYAALFSFIWKFRKLKDGDLHGKVRQLVDKSGFAIRTGVVQTYRLFTPQDIEWVAAS